MASLKAPAPNAVTRGKQSQPLPCELGGTQFRPQHPFPSLSSLLFFLASCPALRYCPAGIQAVLLCRPQPGAAGMTPCLSEPGGSFCVAVGFEARTGMSCPRLLEPPWFQTTASPHSLHVGVRRGHSKARDPTQGSPEAGLQTQLCPHKLDTPAGQALGPWRVRFLIYIIGAVVSPAPHPAPTQLLSNNFGKNPGKRQNRNRSKGHSKQVNVTINKKA